MNLCRKHCHPARRSLPVKGTPHPYGGKAANGCAVSAATPHISAFSILTAACTGCECLPEIATGAERPRNDKSGAVAILSLPNTNRRCSARSGMPLPYSARPEVCVFFILHFSVFRIHFHAPLPYNARTETFHFHPALSLHITLQISSFYGKSTKIRGGTRNVR